VVNVVDWPQIISSIRSIEVLTPGPVREGTRLREDRIMFRREGTQELEVATIERPRRLQLLAEHPHLRYELDHVIDSVHGGGCRIRLIFKSTWDSSRAGSAAPHDTVHGNYVARRAGARLIRSCLRSLPAKLMTSDGHAAN
jgi:hypothetical protein